MSEHELTANQNDTPDTGLVDGPRLLETLFPNPACRPSLRWLKDREKQRALPFMRIGRLIFYNPPAVRAAMEAKTLTMKSRGLPH
jgi:hypothetical protein